MIKIIILNILISIPLYIWGQEWSCPTFAHWDEHCSQLPKFRTFRYDKENKIINKWGVFCDTHNYNIYHAVSAADFERALNSFFTIVNSSALSTAVSWVENAPGQDSVFFDERYSTDFMPYAQKLIVTPGTEISFHGDLHGDVHSLLAYIRKLQDDGYMDPIDGFNIKPDKNLYIIFLGDYVDRGIYGAEVLYTLMRLKIANPERVILVRGNHEDPGLTRHFGFDTELANKFDDSEEVERIQKKLVKFYNLLPVVLYLGCNNNFVQCCHGGLEIGYNPLRFFKAQTAQFQWLGELKQKDEWQKIDTKLDKTTMEIQECQALTFLSEFFDNFQPTSPVSNREAHEELNPKVLGFMWNDFQPDVFGYSLFHDQRGYMFNQRFTRAALQVASDTTHKLCGVIRAHQHVPFITDMLMQQMLASHGVARLWSGCTSIDFTFWDTIVITLLLSPDSLYGGPNPLFNGFTFDTSLLIKPADDFYDWRGTAINNEIYQ